MYFLLLETGLGGGSEMHKQEELGQISDAAGERDQNTEGEPELSGLLQENTCRTIAITKLIHSVQLYTSFCWIKRSAYFLQTKWSPYCYYQTGCLLKIYSTSLKYSNPLNFFRVFLVLGFPWGLKKY